MVVLDTRACEGGMCARRCSRSTARIGLPPTNIRLAAACAERGRLVVAAGGRRRLCPSARYSVLNVRCTVLYAVHHTTYCTQTTRCTACHPPHPLVSLLPCAVPKSVHKDHTYHTGIEPVSSRGTLSLSRSLASMPAAASNLWEGEREREREEAGEKSEGFGDECPMRVVRALLLLHAARIRHPSSCALFVPIVTLRLYTHTECAQRTESG